jgi:hypothetical protein
MRVYLLGSGDGGIILGDGSGYLLLGDSPVDVSPSLVMSRLEYQEDERPDKDKYTFRVKREW